MGSWIELSLFILLLFIIIPLLGFYLSRVFDDESNLSLPPFSWLEKALYRLGGIQESQEMSGKDYLKALIYFNLFGLIFLFVLQLVQQWLPLNPQGFSNVEPLLAFNTAASFVTNTNWQAYGGENSLSYLTQMSGMTVQNFLSAATGNAVLIAFIRGIKRKSSQTIGNFWKDMVRTIVYVLLPFSIILALILVSQGVVQTLSPYVEATPIEQTAQWIPLGPVASQVAIKQLGTNGGGYFNANSAHPFENPTSLTNCLEVLAILMIPMAATYMYGLMLKSRQEGIVILIVMSVFWFGGFAIAIGSEMLSYTPALEVYPILEGKETRLGSIRSVFWTTATTATANGSTNSMISSLSPLSGGVALFNMMLGEVVFGGVGVGLCGMLMFVLLTVFLAGLMVGRTPEYMGKKIEKREMRWVMLAILAPAGLVLIGSGIASVLPVALSSVSSEGPHGLSEILYAFASAAGNNGSAFAGLNANTPFYNIILGVIMILARLAIIAPSIAIASCLASKKKMAPSLGTFPTQSILFAVLLFSVIFIFAALTFFPALSLGPIVEELLMLKGRSF